VTTHVGQAHTIITVDQALYCKLKELQWSIPAYQDQLVICLGGLHTMFAFLATIGNNMGESGLKEAWVESGIIGSDAADAVLNGRKYKRAMRIHKITVQALWQLIIPDLLEFCEQSNP
jgi:hypothetical protein